jgi:hypothetical protein
MPGTEHPKIVGDRTQLAVMAALHEAGYGLYVPFGENTRCDLIVEQRGMLARIQVKTGRLRGGAVEFNVCSTNGHHPHATILKRTYEGEVDLFAVHCRDTSGVYLIPIEHLPMKYTARLRVERSKNNQHENVRWAGAYEIGTVAIGGLRGPSGA